MQRSRYLLALLCFITMVCAVTVQPLQAAGTTGMMVTDESAYYFQSEADTSDSEPDVRAAQTVSSPEVINTTPANGAGGVEGISDIEIYFDRPVQPNPLVDVEVKENKAGIFEEITGLDFVFNNDLLKVSAPELKPGTTYRIDIPYGAVSDGLLNYNEPYSFSFTTKAVEEPVLSVISTMPEPGQANLPGNTKIEVVFGAVITPVNTGLVSLKDQNGDPVDSTEVSVSGSKLTVGHQFLVSGDYTLTVPTGAVKGLVGDLLLGEDLSFSFNIGDPPKVTSTVPSAGALSVDTKADVIINLDRQVRIINPGYLVLLNQSGSIVDSVSAILELSSDKRAGLKDITSDKIRITHAELDHNKTYYAAMLEGAVKDNDNLINAKYIWNFTTAAAEGPSVIETKPANGGTEVAVDSVITVKFSEGILANNMSGIYIYDTSENAVDSIDADIVGFPLKSASGGIIGNEIEIKHARFEPEKQYYVTIPQGAVINSDSVQNSSYTFSFTTTGAAAPDIIAVTPQSGADDVPVNTEISLTFDQQVSAVNLTNVSLYDQNSNRVEAATASLQGNKITLSNPGLDYSTTYAVIVDNNVVKNDNGVHNSSHTWSFTTIAEPEEITVTDYTPDANATAVSVNTPVSISFSANVLANNTELIRIKDQSGAAAEISGVSINNNTLEISHSPFDFGTKYTVEIPAGALKSASETTNDFLSWDFTTEFPQPAVQSFDPLDESTGVLPDHLLRVTFNQHLQAQSLSGIVVESEAGDVVSGLSAEMQGNQLVIDHGELKRGTLYTVKIPSGSLANSDGVTTDLIRWSFTTLLLPPSILSTEPADGAERIALSDTIKVFTDQKIELVDKPQLSIKETDSEVLNSDEVIVDEKVLYIIPDTLKNDTEYTVQLNVGLIQNTDSVRNELYTFTFRTIKAKPGIADVFPADSSKSVPVDTDIKIFFDQTNLSTTDISGVRIEDDKGSAVTPLTKELTNDGLVIKHPGLDFSTTYRVTLDKGFIQNSDEVANAAFSWVFTTKNPPPKVLSTMPENGATAVPTEGQLKVKFDQKILKADESGVQPEAVNDLGISIQTVFSAVDDSVLILNYGPLNKGRSYTVTVPEGMVMNADSIGNTAYSWSFTTILAAPEVVSTQPAGDASGVSVDSDITVIFNQLLTAVQPESVTLMDETGSTVPGFNLNLSGSVLSLKHGGLEKGKVYTVNIPAGAFSNKDGISNKEFIWSFETEYGQPVPVNPEPADGSTGADPGAGISVQFNQILSSADPSAITLNIDGDTQNILTGAEVSEFELILSHSGLLRGTVYRVTLESGAVFNPGGLTNEAFSWTFRTLLEAPAIVNTSPSENAEDVETGVPVNFTFNQQVEVIDLSAITITDEQDTPVQLTISLLNGNTVVLDHEEFKPGMNYTVHIPEGIVQNEDGLSNSEYIWTFRTAFTVPRIVSTVPEANELKVNINEQVGIFFDQQVSVRDQSLISITDENGDNLVITGTEIAGNYLELNTGAFEHGRRYTVSLAEGAVENQEGQFAEAHSWSFTTILAAPEVISSNPEEGAVQVDVNLQIVLNFSQEIFLASEPGFELITDSETITGLGLSTEGNQLQIQLPELDKGIDYRLNMNLGAVENSDGVPNASFSLNFRTLSARPEIVSHLPEAGRVQVPVSSDIIIDFSQNIDINDGSNLRVIDAASNPVNNISYDVDGSRLRASSPGLNSGTVYRVEVPEGFVRNSDQLVNEAYSWTFRTLMESPQVMKVEPEFGETGVTVDTPVRVYFNQPLSFFDASLVYLSDPDGNRVRGDINVEDDTVMVFRPQEMERAVLYTVHIENNAVMNEDEAGNTALNWTFRTLLNAPQVVSIIPSDSTESVSLTDDIEVEFDQPVDVADLSGIRIFESEGTGEAAVSGNSLIENRLILSHEEFQHNTFYTVQIPEGALVNEDDVPSPAAEWSFKTVLVVPDDVTVQVNRDFGAASSVSDYRLVALPGSIDAPLHEVMAGEYGVNWTAFWDDGSDENYMIGYDGSDLFRFRAGNGFWVTSTEALKFDGTIGTVALNKENQYAIDLHPGWNIISNPLGVDVRWSDVEKTNEAILQPVWAFEGGFTDRTVFSSAVKGEAFYFLNHHGLDSLVIPYIPAPEATKIKAGAAGQMLSLRLLNEQSKASEIKWVIRSETADDITDVVSPPAGFTPVSMTFVGEEPEGAGRQSRLYKKHEIWSGSGLTAEIEITVNEPGTYHILAEGLSIKNDLPETLLLINKDSGLSYRLNDEGKGTAIELKETSGRWILAFGSEAFAQKELDDYLPERVEIHPNYPNPFNPATQLSFRLPEAANVDVKVYNMLGQEVAVVLQGEMLRAGKHSFEFNAGNLSSGIYFAEFRIGSSRYTQKMLLMK